MEFVQAVHHPKLIPHRTELHPAFQVVWEVVERQVFAAPSSERAFNQYRDRNEEFDVPDAAGIRRSNLWNYFACYEALPPVFILAEAPGPWGCRFSGVPIVSEAQLLDPAFPILGARTSKAAEPHVEYSASIYWRVLQPFFPHFFTWNSFPFHPHRDDEPLSIRTPGLREIAAFDGLLQALLEVLKPKKVIAVGRRAEYALGRINKPARYVRHPSQGGAVRFEEGILSAVRHSAAGP